MPQPEGDDDPRTRHPILLATVSFGLALMLLALLGHRLSHLDEHERPAAEAPRSASR